MHLFELFTKVAPWTYEKVGDKINFRFKVNGRSYQGRFGKVNAQFRIDFGGGNDDDDQMYKDSPPRPKPSPQDTFQVFNTVAAIIVDAIKKFNLTELFIQTVGGGHTRSYDHWIMKTFLTNHPDWEVDRDVKPRNFGMWMLRKKTNAVQA